jgi:hypothetical protein
MRRESKAERDAWTRHFEENAEPAPVNKYGNQRSGKYASKHEEAAAINYAALVSCGRITELKEQDRIVLVPGDGKLRPIVYVADFTYMDEFGIKHVVDAKGYKTQIYRLKKRMAALLLGLTIEEV